MTKLTPDHESWRQQQAAAQRIYEPKWGGKDHSGYDTLMKYEVNDEREEAFLAGMAAEHEVALLIGRIELAKQLNGTGVLISGIIPVEFSYTDIISKAEAQLAALLSGGKGSE